MSKTKSMMKSKRKSKKEEPVYDPNLFVRNPTPTPDLTADEQIIQLGKRRVKLMGQIGWLLNDNTDYDRIVRDVPPLQKEVKEIDAVLDVAR